MRERAPTMRSDLASADMFPNVTPLDETIDHVRGAAGASHADMVHRRRVAP
jgi:hypothetical protein